MKRPFKLWIAIGILFVIGGVWLWQGSAYPHTIYEYHYTGRVLDQYIDRAAGLEVEAEPIWEPHNPTWVDMMRSGFVRLFLLGLVIYIIYLEATFRDKRRKYPPETHWCSYETDYRLKE